MDDRQKGSVTLLDKDGQVFAWRGDQFGGLVFADTVSPHLLDAILATEDKRFYRHFGLSLRGILGAMRTNLFEGRSALAGHGGSTITQQVAKDAFFADLPSKERKIKEIPMSLAMEIKYSKRDILSMYLNRPYLGAGSNGFEAAAQRYFGKSARDVDIAESAMLAGLLKAPSANAPTNNLQRSVNRANLVVGLMQRQGRITAEEADFARANPATLSTAAKEKAGGYFADWVMEIAPDFIIKNTTEDIIIHSTFDPFVQKAAEEALQFVFDTKVSKQSRAQAAIVVMSPDGSVRAMVGGRDTKQQGTFNRATQALRQTGSSFKPFIYASAMTQGYLPNDIVLDAPITLQVAGSGAWSPQNYKKGEYLGRISLTQALAESINTSAVRVAEKIGRVRVRALARDFGITRKLAEGPALALGVSESTLIEMTGAYGGIATGGVAVKPYAINNLTIQGEPAALLGKTGGLGARVIEPAAASDLIYMLTQVIETGTGTRAILPDGRAIAGKTGTTQGARDAWFIGFSADYITGVWMGYDDNARLANVTGGSLPADIWRETMVRIHEDLPLRALFADEGAPVRGLARRKRRVIGDGGADEDTKARTILDQILDSLTGK